MPLVFPDQAAAQAANSPASDAAAAAQGVKPQQPAGRLVFPRQATLRDAGSIVSDIGTAIWEGAKSTGRMLSSTGNTLGGDLAAVEELSRAQAAAESQGPDAKALLMQEIARRKAANPDAGWLDVIRSVGTAFVAQPEGSAQFVAEQAPNTAVAMGAGIAGAKGGAALGSLIMPGVGTAVGGVAGFLGGMFLGNSALEIGGKAMEKAQERQQQGGAMTPDDASAAIREGAVKGGVVTGVDAVTLGAGRGVARAFNRSAIQAGARAEAKVLADAGVDITSRSAIERSLAADPVLRATAQEAGKAAAQSTSRFGNRAATGGTLLTMETVGEGTGEYLGELAATGKADKYDAVMEAMAGLSQSIPETAWNMRQSQGNDLNARGIERAGNEPPAPGQPPAPAPGQPAPPALPPAPAAPAGTIVPPAGPGGAPGAAVPPLDPEAIPPELDAQNRDRTRPASILQMQSIAQNPDYLRLGPSRSPDTGAPLVFAQGDDTSLFPSFTRGREDVAVMSDGQRVPFQYAVVDASMLQPSNFSDGTPNPLFGDETPGLVKALSNGRSAGLRSAWAQGTATQYAADLEADTDQHGVSPEAIRATRNPVLVRLYSQADNKPNMAARSQGQGLGMSPGELARQDAPLIDAGLLSVWQGGDVADARNLDFVRGFVGRLQGSGQDLAGMMTQAGTLSPDGRKRIQAALAQSAYGDADLIGEMFDSTDTDIKAIGEALKMAAPEWADMRDSARTGAIDPAADITPALLGAVGMVRRARQQRQSLSDLARQTDITTGQTPDPMVLGALRMLYGGEYLTRPMGRDRMAEFLREYTRLAKGITADAGLFGDAPAPMDVLTALTKEDTNGQQQPGATQPATQPGPGSQQPAGGSSARGDAGAGGAAAARPGDNAGRAQPAAGGGGQLAQPEPEGQAAAPGVAPGNQPRIGDAFDAAGWAEQENKINKKTGQPVLSEGRVRYKRTDERGFEQTVVVQNGKVTTSSSVSPIIELTNSYLDDEAPVRGRVHVGNSDVQGLTLAFVPEDSSNAVTTKMSPRAVQEYKAGVPIEKIAETEFSDAGGIKPDGTKTPHTTVGKLAAPVAAPAAPAPAQAPAPTPAAQEEERRKKLISTTMAQKFQRLAFNQSGDGRFTVSGTLDDRDALELSLTDEERKLLKRADALQELAETPEERNEASAAKEAALRPAVERLLGPPAAAPAAAPAPGPAPAPADDLDAMFNDVLDEELGKTKPAGKALPDWTSAVEFPEGTEFRWEDGTDGPMLVASMGGKEVARSTEAQAKAGTSFGTLKMKKALADEQLRQMGQSTDLTSRPAGADTSTQDRRDRAERKAQQRGNASSALTAAIEKAEKAGATGVKDKLVGLRMAMDRKDKSPGQVLYALESLDKDIARELGKSDRQQAQGGATLPEGAGGSWPTPDADTPRTAGQAAASAAQNVGQGLNNAIDGLGALFGGKTPGRLGSGPTFDEETYAKAKPLFQAALANFKDAAFDIREAMRAVVRMVLDKFGEDAARNMQPYVVRFVRDVRDGVVKLTAQQQPQQPPTDPVRQRIAMPDGMELHLFTTSDGWGTGLFDAEAEQYVDGSVTRFKGDDAEARARQSMRNQEARIRYSATPTLTTPAGRAALAQTIADRFIGGDGFKTIIEARKFIAEATGEKIEAGTQAAKLADETIEMAVVLAGRDIVRAARAQGRDDGVIYDRLVSLYGLQPTLGVRTSTSVREQAYSTPVPLAFLASRRAMVMPDSEVGEPTAGNTMLLIEVDPERATVNELNADRAANARALGFQVTSHDAARHQLAPEKTLDRVVANPPFGAVKDDKGETIVFPVAANYGTREIDHAIAFKALDAMKDDGSAVLILGGVDASNEDAIREGYRGKSKREFYFRLYGLYNVVDHFTVDGGLYSKQGAGYPVDVVVIRGRGKATRAMPAADLPKRYDTWEALKKEKLDGTTEATPADGMVPTGAATGTGSGRGQQDGQPGRGPVVDGAGRPGAGTGGQGARPGRGGDVGGALDGQAGSAEQPGRRGGAGTAQPGATDGPDAGRNGAAQRPVSGQGARGDGARAPGAAGDRPGDVGGSGPGAGQRVESGLSDRRGQEQETATQVEYAPQSGAASVGTLVPRAMRESITASLKRVADMVGDIDKFVAEKLNFAPDTLRANFSAEQVDALALAIVSAEAGKGFIIGDQTGIGKGRVVAAMLRYAMINGKVPVFVTEKPNLYADMIRDLDDIGMGDELRLQSNKPLILATNSSEPIPYVLQRKSGDTVIETEHTLRAPGAGKDLEKLFDGIAANGDISPYKVVFTTYSQLQTVKGQVTARMRMVRALSEGGYMVFDESHNAGGTQIAQPRSKKDREAAKAGDTTSGRSGFVRSLVRGSSGSFFSSATYAKRPDVLDLYSSTNMMLAVDRPADLAPAIMLGGVPMQQIVATMLAEDGQYIRRERTFAGVTYETRPMSVDRQTAENMAQSMRMVLAFSRAKEAAVTSMQKEFDREGAMVRAEGGEKTTVQGANFGAIMHNLIDQMLLSLKSQQSVDFAIERLKAGEKVVLTVANTMGSFLADYAEEFGVRPGEPVTLSFADLYQRYLEKQRIVKIKRPGGPKQGVPYRLTDQDLGAGLVEQYNEVSRFIQEAGFGAAPISPIDYMHDRLRAAGYKTDEITGRSVTVNYGGSMPTLASRNANIKQRLKAIRGFNSGDVDVIILNQSGSTGLSLHASSKVKDQRKRRMIIVQAEKNIDTHMQMLGRVHRTGQVITPDYTQAMADIPAEARPASVLLKKMASLNANTTASRKSAVTAEGVVDFMNDYGGQVAAEFLLDNPEVHMDLGGQKVLEIPADVAEADEELIRKLTGYIPILPIEQQESVYRDLVDRYNELLARENAMGTNKLEAAALDLGAKTEKREQITTKRETPVPSRFAEPAFMEQVDVARTVKPLTKAEVQEAVAKALNGKTPDKVAEELRMSMDERMTKFLDDLKKLRMAKGADTDKEKQTHMLQEMERHRMQQSIVTDLLYRFKIGQEVSLLDQHQTVTYGVITSVSTSGTTKSPAAGSAWKFTLALANGEARSITFSASQIDKQFTMRSERGPVMTLNPSTNEMTSIRILDLFDAYGGSGNVRREKRWMVTGNLLAGFASYPGQILNYTKDDGTTAQGVLMRRGFDFEKKRGEAKAAFPSVDLIRKFFGEAGTDSVIATPDNVLRVRWEGERQYYAAVFEVASSKREGGQFYLDRGLTNAIGRDFTKVGQVMRAMVTEADMMRGLQYLLTERDDVKLEAKTNKDVARRVLGLPDVTDSQKSRVAREEQAVYRVKERDTEERDVPFDLFPDTFEALQPVAADPRVNRKRRNPGGVPVADETPTAVLAVREDPALPGMYHHTSQLVQVGMRDMPVARVTNWREAASALSALGKFAVEHVDVLVTDKDGKPLAVVGAFKGALSEAQVFPTTVLAEALRIEGAAAAWAVHNHPSGNEQLSAADKRLSQTLGSIFEPSTVEWMGIAALGDGTYSAYTGQDVETGILIEGKTVARVPLVNRTIQRLNVGLPVIDTTDKAKSLVANYSNGKPGLLFVSTQHQVTAWVPVNPKEMAKLRVDGRFDRLINSAAEAGARAVLIANPGGAMPTATLDNIASALAKLDVKVLDVVDPKKNTSMAEAGLEPIAWKPVFSRADAGATGITEAQARKVADAVAARWESPPPVVVVQTMQDTRVPAEVRAEDERQRKGGAKESVKGFMYQGVAYLVADGLTSDADAAETLMHEALGHYGLRAAFGKSLADILDMIALARPDLMRPKAAEYGQVLTLADAKAVVQQSRQAQGARPGAQSIEAEAAALLRQSRRIVAEEVLASMAQTEPNLGFVRRAVAAIRTWLRENVPAMRDIRLSDDEIIRNYILPARAFVERGVKADAPAGMSAAFSRMGQALRTSTPEFKRWSKGLPVYESLEDGGNSRGVYKVYHATTANFNEFIPGGLNQNDSGQAIWLSPSATYQAALFRVGGQGRYNPGANVMPLYARLERPMVIDDKDMLEWARAAFEAGSEFPQIITPRAKKLITEEYDSIIFDGDALGWNKGEPEGVTAQEIIVFEPTQIKSAIGNSGAFDPTNPDIRFARGARSNVNRMTAEQVQAEVKALMPRVDEAYEAGNLALAERLDARLETLMEALESNFVELEEDRLTAVDLLNPVMAARIAEGEQGDAEADVVRNLANTWKELSDGRWGYGNMTAGEKADLLRGMLDDYAWRHGGLKPGLTDRQILDAAEDAFKSVYGMRAEQLARIRRGRDLSMVRPANTPMFARGPAPTLTAAQRAENILSTPVMQARPLDRVFRTASRLTGLEYVTKRVYGRAGYLLDRFTPETVKAGIVSDYGVPEAVIDMRVMLQGRQRQQLRKAGELLDKLANLTRDESRVAYEWMNMDGSDPRAYISMMQGLPEESVKVLQEVQRMIDDLSKEAVRLGQLDPRSYERNKFAYLRRTYDRYLEELSPQQRASHQRATRILGDQYRMRGLVEPVDMAKIKSGDPEWWGRKEKEGKGDTGLVNQKFIKLERLKPTGAGTAPLPGMTGRPDGKVLEVVYWPAERTIPAKYSEWRRNEVFEVRDVKGGKVVLWRDFTKDEREAMGEVDEARFAIARTLQRMVHDVEVGRYLEGLSQKFAKADGDEIEGNLVEASESWHRAFKPDDWVKVPDSKITGTSVYRYGKLAGKYLPGPIWNDVRFAVNGPSRPLGEVYSRMLTAWKVAKTALTPAVHMNNVMANLVMADWHDVGAAHVAKALRVILAAHQRDGKGGLGRLGNVLANGGIADRDAALEVMNRYRDAGGDIGSWATQEVAREQMAPLLDAVLAELGRDGDASVQGQVGVMAALQHMLHLKLPDAWRAFKASKPATVVGREAESMIDLYQAEDDVFRLAAWLRAKEQGLDDLRAGREARRSFLDYDINAPWVDAMRRSAWPFVAFTYRAVPMLFEIAGKRPHKILKLATLLGALNMVGMLMSGDDEDEDERRRRMLPEEKAGRVWGIVPKLIRMPWDDKNGSPVYLDIRRFVPVGDIVDTGATQAALPVPPGLMPGGPLVILGEVLMNKSAFTGKPIVLGTDTPTEVASKVFSHLYKGFAPNLPGLPGTYATDAIVNAGTGKTDAFGREQSVAQAVASSVGVKLGSYPEDVLRRNTMAKAKGEEREIETVIRGLQRQRLTNAISQEEFDRKVEVQRNKLRKLGEETREKVAQ